MPLLEVKDLHTSFRTEDGIVRAVAGVSFSLERGRVLGIVGESGSGKSVTCRTILGLVPARRTEVTGQALFKGRDLLKMSRAELRQMRGRDIAMIFQDPMTSLNPVMSVGAQLVEAIQLHEKVAGRVARQRCQEMLAAVGIPNPAERLKNYPHELSGGMRQRAMIAMALLNNPDLLIADEPTTALDVTTQAQILNLIRRLRREFDSAIILITHDLGVIAEICDEVLVMYAGQIVEQGPVEAIFEQPAHPYTWGLLGSLPRLNEGREQLYSIPGAPPSLLRPPSGCVFHPRCAYVLPVCREHRPPLLAGDGPEMTNHRAACHLEPAFRVQESTRLFGQLESGSGP
ncbi:MAG: ABC transporter ATP-binding protein [Anaerolineales bacterium]|nr:ABC transporter ATP-binding protein [Anaerolineales bacterium]